VLLKVAQPAKQRFQGDELNADDAQQHANGQFFEHVRRPRSSNDIVCLRGQQRNAVEAAAAIQVSLHDLRRALAGESLHLCREAADMSETVKEASAAAATIGSWGLWGWSLTQVNEALTALSLIAATVASIAATVYYIRSKRK
jgi:hypothetical protein